MQVPTTLVAQVDSAYGGKTGVDLPEAKNYVGAYHQPAGVLVDPDTLATLPAAELAAGWVEVLKTALIAGGDAVGAGRGRRRGRRAHDPRLRAHEARGRRRRRARRRPPAGAQPRAHRRPRDRDRDRLRPLPPRRGRRPRAARRAAPLRAGRPARAGARAAARARAARDARGAASTSSIVAATARDKKRVGARRPVRARRARRARSTTAARSHDADLRAAVRGAGRDDPRALPHRGDARRQPRSARPSRSRCSTARSRCRAASAQIDRRAKELGLQVRFFQTNHEGEFIEHLHSLARRGRRRSCSTPALDALRLGDPRRARDRGAAGGGDPPLRHRESRGRGGGSR